MPRPPVQEPTVKPGMHARHSPESQTLEHPAFGQIQASRVTGRVTLFGSDFEHDHFIAIRVHRSQLNRELGRDWPSPGEELIEVSLSPWQWAEFVSSLNHGTGVQCTLNRVVGEQMPTFPLRDEKEVYKSELGQRMGRLVGRIDAAIAAVEAELAGVSAKKKAAVTGHLQGLRTEVQSNMPFFLKQFGEKMEDYVQKAKTEVLAFMEHAMHRVGRARLASGEEVTPPLAITAGVSRPETTDPMEDA